MIYCMQENKGLRWSTFYTVREKCPGSKYKSVTVYLQTFKTLQNAFQNTAKTSVKNQYRKLKKFTEHWPIFFKCTIKALPDTHQMMRMETLYLLGRLW